MAKEGREEVGEDPVRDDQVVKKVKKKKDKRTTAAEENGANGHYVDAPASVTEGAKGEKGKKKKKKKKREAEATDPEPSTAAPPADAQRVDKPKKKVKTGKGDGPTGSTNGVLLEGLGDGSGPDLGKDLGVQVSGSGSKDAKFAAVKTFAGAGLPDSMTRVFGGFKNPSPIQAHAWPVLRGGRDFIGIAKTGSGKTLAFGVPAFLHVAAKKKGSVGKGSGPRCLIVAPTRELAQQIAEVLEEFGTPSGVHTTCVYGGAPKGPQKGALRRDPDIVVATPGRLLDLVEEGCCQLGRASFVVLDEADRMLDLGFEPAIRAILEKTPKDRQTVMLSATWPPAVGQLAAEFVRDPIKVTIGSEELTANHDVTQIVEVVEDRARDSRLDALLRKYHSSRKNRVLVFVLYKKEAARVESMLSSRGWVAAAIHGDKGQADRTRAVVDFKSGAVPLLIATDVAARGLDIPNVEFVINYSFPLTTEDYVHRIGRTGRAGKTGIAHTFFTHNDRARAGELVNVLREAGQTVPEDLLKFGTAVKKKESKLYGAHFREITADTPKASKITFADSDDE